MTTVDFEPLTIAVPLREEPAGVLRVGESRVLLELVLRAFKAGATPESIVQSYDTLHLTDVYAVITRYLAASEPFEEYLRTRDEAAAQTRRKIDELQGPQGNLRAVLLAARKPRRRRVLKLVSDENFDGDILRGLFRRCPQLDVVRVQDIGLNATPDPEILAWAASDERVLLTHDRETVPGFAYDRVRAGEPMPGVFLVDDQMSIGEAINETLLAADCLTPEECKNMVRFFPL